MAEENSRLVAEFQKNSAEMIKVHLQKFRGGMYCDLRVWVSEKAGQGGAECATRKGLTISTELLPQLIGALDKAQRTLEAGPEVQVVNG